MDKTRFLAVILLLVGILIGFFVYYSQTPGTSFYRPFKLGLDLSGGSHLVYQADVSKLNPADVPDAMSSLREVIDRRVNVFGVSEPIVQVETSPLGGVSANRLIVDLPGVTDVKQAAEMISQTPVLEFKTERGTSTNKTEIVKARTQVQDYVITQASDTPPAILNQQLIDRFGADTLKLAQEDPDFVSTELTGRYLKKAQVNFSQNSLGPSISVEFNSDGSKLFDDLTKANINKKIGIFLDGQLISAPTVREEIRDGRAEISGQFTIEEAKNLVRDLNLGALPVPISLASTQTIGATLGGEAARRGIEAGLIGLLLVAVFMIVWYRLPGLVSVVALAIYVSLMLAIFKLVPVTLTAAGMAGFILSIGIAVDANVLIFERTKEELMKGKAVHDGLLEGFSRAWPSIRDSNLSSIISSIVLFWFGTSMIKGFALTMLLGIVISMFTAVVVSRTFLLALPFRNNNNLAKFLFGNSFFNK